MAMVGGRYTVKTLNMRNLVCNVVIVVFKTKGFTKDREGHYIVVKRPTNQEDLVILNVYAPNNKASKTLTKNKEKN